ncbi:cobaltochelatase CobN subunit [Mangrovibacterium diazotrophicum]|uniref:Cobaltochelatase CobN subunit n=2 Tax=Mangrovibacterium diazotrophicum TaxID=1261403 RepID=A0A419W8Y5_9BACT|nr:cobaltochelatase CobN subunit [Mangrovibacterium diazotrophicum]
MCLRTNKTKYTILLLAMLLQLAFSSRTVAEAKPLRVSLLLSDSYTQLGERAAEAIKVATKDGKPIEVRVFPYSRYYQQEKQFVAESDLIFADVLHAEIVSQAVKELKQASRHGAKIYAVGADKLADSPEGVQLNYDAQVLDFYSQSGRENLKRMVLEKLRTDLAYPVAKQQVLQIPEYGLYNTEDGQFYSTLADYQAHRRTQEAGNPWVGLNIWRSDILSEQMESVNSHIQKLEEAGFNVLPYFGQVPLDELKTYFFRQDGKPLLSVVAGMSSWLGVNPDLQRETFKELNVPVINLVQVNDTLEAWEDSETGIALYKRTNALSIPEQSGMIQPIVTSVKDFDPATGAQEKVPAQRQLKRFVDRVKAFHLLQTKPNSKKRVALIYYSHPPGKESLGASYLNVMPQSLHNMLNRMQTEGYDLGGMDIREDNIYKQVMEHGRNVGDWAPAETAKLAQSGKAVLVPISLYKKWLSELSPKLVAEVEHHWGLPDTTSIMTWENSKKERFFVLPAVPCGNVLLMPQPVRGWTQGIDVMHHDITLPPHHQYLAFYLYLQHSFHADAVVHIGTHSTLEWLPGKETGLSESDVSEALIGHMVNIYPYIMDDVGEGLQAKRRSGAIILTHMTPPFTRLQLNPEVKELARLMSEYEVAESKSKLLSQAKLAAINEKAKAAGVLKDLGLTEIKEEKDFQLLEHYVEEILEQESPMGLHSFGESPAPKYLEETAKAIASQQDHLSGKAKEDWLNNIRQKLQATGKAELDALIAALNGQYIEAGSGNDPIRNPDALPTGKNFYAFDPSHLPSESVYKAGTQLAKDFISDYNVKHDGQFPDKVTFNLWSTECIRNEGIMEAQIMYLLGVRPKYDGYGKVVDVEIIPRRVLGRARVDVVMVPSGLYRDIFPTLMKLLDKAVKLAAKQNEVDNYIRLHTEAARQKLVEAGVGKAEAEKLALVRMFTTPEGAYGTGTNTMIEASGQWESDREVAQLYMKRMHFPYGEDYWGSVSNPKVTDKVLKDLLAQNLSGSKAVLHSRTSHLYGALDNDDFFQYLGGTALTVRALDGQTPDVMISNLTQKGNMRQESLDQFIGREMQTRYLNPEWINAMMDEGYAGSRFVRMMVTNLWGWQVTTPEAIDEGKWNRVYDTYVEDKYQLDLKRKFMQPENVYAYQVLLSQMMEVTRKDYWHADEKQMQTMLKAFNETVKQAGLSCNENVCDNPKLADYIGQELEKVPGLTTADLQVYREALKTIKKVDLSQQQMPENANLAQDQANPDQSYLPKSTVKGYQVEEVSKTQADNSKPLATPEFYRYLLLALIAVIAVAFFWKK